jgi:hypothetical protein
MAHAWIRGGESQQWLIYPTISHPGLMSGDWKRSTVLGPQRLQLDPWTAPSDRQPRQPPILPRIVSCEAAAWLRY